MSAFTVAELAYLRTKLRLYYICLFAASNRLVVL